MFRHFISIIFFTVTLTLAGCSGYNASDDSSTGMLQPTIYYRPVINLKSEQCLPSQVQHITEPSGKVITSMCESSFKKCEMQGSCLLLGQKTQKGIGYAGFRNGKSLFVETDIKACPFGRGVKDDLCLDPFFSIAADMNYFKPGDVIFIPLLKGLELPDGQIHDGFLIVRDEGGGVKGSARFDFFTGYFNYTDKKNIFSSLGFADPKNRIGYRIASSAEAERVRVNRNYPSIPDMVLQQGRDYSK